MPSREAIFKVTISKFFVGDRGNSKEVSIATSAYTAILYHDNYGSSHTQSGGSVE